MIRRTSPIEDYRRVHLAGDEVQYTCAGKCIWSIPLAHLRIIGEYTTDASHWFDDYFIVFIQN